jgi:hypothetical protein
VKAPEPAADPRPAGEPEKKIKVHLTSAPARVEVYQAGGLLGRTPFSLPRPGNKEPALDLVLKADGYKDLAVRVTYLTQEELHVELEKVRRSSGGTARPTPTPVPSPEEKKPVRKPPSAPSTEVLDPWSN